MILSDGDIKKHLAAGDILIEDFDEARLQPASYDVLLGTDFLVYDHQNLSVIDPREDISKFMRKVIVPNDGHFVLQAGEFALGMVADFVGVGPEYAIELMGKSSLARLGLIIHTTAGFIDPGNQLNVTLELFNTNKVAIKLYPGMKIAQICFRKLSSPAEKPYGTKGLNSKYFNARTVQASAMHKNFKKPQKDDKKNK